MQRNRFWLKRLTVLFMFITVVLWSIKLAVRYKVTCPAPSTNRIVDLRKGADQHNTIENVTKWFANQVLSHHQSSPQSSCAATNGSSGLMRRLDPLSDTQQHHPYLEQTVTLAAIGDLHLKLGGSRHLEQNASQFLKGISEFVSHSDAVITNLESALDKQPETVEVLRSIRSLGVRVVSLANDPISQQATQGTAIRDTTRALEAADIRWLGLNAKQHQIVVINGQRIGFLAFCGVHGLCIQQSNMPFAPLKYSAKVAGNAVNELREHGVEIIIVLMYWGRESSYFPDETALVIARCLAHLGVTVVIGYHPNVVQDHAYFGNTLVLFSLGNVLTSDIATPYCWQQVAGEWVYSSSADHCKIVHPKAREGLRHHEQQTRVYRIHISRSHPAIAEFVTLPLEYSVQTQQHGYRIKRPVVHKHNNTLQWTVACGESDTHCLTCEQL